MNQGLTELEMIRYIETSLMARVPEHKLRPRLEPTRRAVELLGDPQKMYRVVHITGTNGKTTTTRIVERILREFGLRTGRFTSPHLIELNERIAIDGEPIETQKFYEVFKDIEPVLEIVDQELLAAGDLRLTFFEALAVLGFACFAEAPVDVLVLEVGMGGEWDSTNVADGDVAVFSPIDLDHIERLGSTIKEIATTKSGIIKPGSAVVSSMQKPEALAVLKDKTAAVADSFDVYGENFEVTSVSEDHVGITFSLKSLAGEYENLFIPLHGKYQAENAALAIAAVEQFFGSAQNALPDAILRSALADVTSPGRLQIIDKRPTVLSIIHSFGSPEAVGVLSVLADKDARGVLEALEPVLLEIILTESSSIRATNSAELADLAKEIFGPERVSTAANVAEGWTLAKTKVSQEGMIVISGSVTLVGDALKLKQEEANG
ncbi:MAG: dihydrofolate synthase [Actinobacteria bacterium]|nr:dihydrofolate synthase [Actinomycetota bacterium]